MFGLKGKGSKREERHERRQPHLSGGQEDYAFRRSRTLTGSVSNRVESAKSGHTDLKSERLKLHVLHRHRRFLKTGLFVVALFAFGLAFFVSNSLLFIEKRFEAAAAVPAEDQQALRDSITAYVNSHPSEAFLINLSERRLTQFMQVQHPEVSSVDVQRQWFGPGGSIVVQFRTPIVAWQVADSRFFVDASGVAFTKHYGPPPALQVEDASGYTPELAANGSVASQRFIGYLGQLLGELRAQDMATVERVVIPPTSRQLNIYLEGRPYPIKTHVDRDPYVQVADIKNALAFFDEKQITPEYIDVRVEGKAYYR